MQYDVRGQLSAQYKRPWDSFRPIRSDVTITDELSEDISVIAVSLRIDQRRTHCLFTVLTQPLNVQTLTSYTSGPAEDKRSVFLEGWVDLRSCISVIYQRLQCREAEKLTADLPW